MPSNPQDALAELRNQPADDKPERRLSPNTTLCLDVVGVEDGKRYRHDFKYKVPTLGDQVEIAKLKSTWLPLGSAADLTGTQLVEMVAYLTICVDSEDAPAWFKEAWKLYDPTPLARLYKEATSYEARFRGKPGLGSGSGSAEELDQERGGHDPGGDGHPAEGAVEPEVSGTPKRRKTLVSSGG